MKKKKVNKTKITMIAILASIIIITLAFVWNTYTNKNYQEGEYIAKRTTNEEQQEDESGEEENNNEQEETTEPATNPTPIDQNEANNAETANQTPAPTPASEPKPAPEQTIASFSTKIYTKDPARQNNINITCNTLNNTIVKNNSSFSFCNTVGQATSKRGYQKADIFDKQGNKKKGLGGGNCQISTTLYNAILKIPNIQITERHAHSNKVPYIQTGKDAAVAYGSYDLKFVNQTGRRH